MAPQILISFSSFKGSVGGREAGEALAQGIRAVLPEANISILALADGGGGTIEAYSIVKPQAQLREAKVCGPLGEPVTAQWLYCPDHQTAVIEMRSAAGLDLLPGNRRDPLRTTTYGVGELIRAAKEGGARHLLLGLGDSATADCGAGMLQALGARFTDQDNQPIDDPMGGADLARVFSVGMGPVRRFFDEFASFKVLCDVENPLLGPFGATEFFAQKGASPEESERLQAGFTSFITQLESDARTTVRHKPGAGAAGGLGAACALCRGRLLPGAETIMDMIGFRRYLEKADLLILGEGSFDGQSLNGKATGTALHRARARNVPVLVICGKNRLTKQALSGFPHVTVHALTQEKDPPLSREESLGALEKLGDFVRNRIEG